RDKAQTAPFEVGTQFKNLCHGAQRRAITLPWHYSLVLIFHFGFTRAQLTQDHQDGLQQVERLKSGNHNWLMLIPGNPFIRPAADDRGDVSWTDKSVQAHVGRIENGPNGGDDGDVIAEYRKVSYALGFGPHQGQGSGGRSGLKSNGKKHHVLVRIGARQFERIGWGINNPNINATRLMFQRTTVSSRHAHHIAEGGEHHWMVSAFSYCQAIINPSHGEHANR